MTVTYGRGVQYKAGFQGKEALFALLDELPLRLQKNALRSGVFRAAQYLRDKARAAAPVDTGLLRKNIKAFRGKYRGKPWVSAYVIAKAPIVMHKGKLVPLDYPYWVEFGHKGFISVPPNPFMRRSFAASVDAMVEIVNKEMFTEVNKRIASLP